MQTKIDKNLPLFKELKVNTDKLRVDLDDLTEKVKENTVEIATVDKAGIVKPDGQTITIESDGTIKATAPTLDEELSDTSTNGVQNKVITNALKNYYTKDEIDIKIGDIESILATVVEV